MVTARILTPRQRLNQKFLYALTWGGIAFDTGALATSGLTLSIWDCALACAILAAGAFAGTLAIQKNPRYAFGSLVGSLGAIIIGGIMGGLMWLATTTYPFAFTGLVCVVGMIITTWLGEKPRLNCSKFARSSLGWAMSIIVVLTLVRSSVVDLPQPRHSSLCLAPHSASGRCFWLLPFSKGRPSSTSKRHQQKEEPRRVAPLSTPPGVFNLLNFCRSQS